jgi:hypothetical protein
LQPVKRAASRITAKTDKSLLISIPSDILTDYYILENSEGKNIDRKDENAKELSRPKVLEGSSGQGLRDNG